MVLWNPLHDTEYCRELVRRFLDAGWYKTYDEDGFRAETAPDVISTKQLVLTNQVMLARSSHRAWEPFLGSRLDELAAIPMDTDLILSPEADVNLAIERVHACYLRLTARVWITDMAASKVLYLKRPKLIAISDSYSRRQLGVPESFGDGRSRSGFAERGVAVLRKARTLGLQHLNALQRLQQYASAEFRALPSLVRIIDIVLWSDEARRQNHKVFRDLKPKVG